MIDRQSYCFDLHHTLSIKFYNQATRIGPCCLADHVEVEPTIPVQQAWQHDFLQDLRHQNLDGTIPRACDTCRHTEELGAHSRRSNFLRYHSDYEVAGSDLRMLDIRLPNLCNLKCTICGPADSTSWIPDAERLGRKVLPIYRYDPNINVNIDNLDLPDTVRIVKFYGGEPLLTEVHADILDRLAQQGLLGQVRLIYNTNGTRRVSQRVLDLWSRAELVEIYFSVDDVGDRFEYQRFPAKWQQVQDNMHWFRDILPHNHLLYVACTVGALNIHNLPAVLDWHAENFSQTRQGDAIQLIFNHVTGDCRLDAVTPEFYHELVARFQNHPVLQQFLNRLRIQSHYVPRDFLTYVRSLDQIRGTDFWQTFPEYRGYRDDV